MYSSRLGALLAATALLLVSSPAHAQKVPWIVLPLAASPFLALVLAAAVGVAAKSWRVGWLNAALVFVWVAWFIGSSNYATSDFVIWASIAALAIHVLVMLWRLLAQRIGRLAPHDET